MPSRQRAHAHPCVCCAGGGGTEASTPVIAEDKATVGTVVVCPPPSPGSPAPPRLPPTPPPWVPSTHPSHPTPCPCHTHPLHIVCAAIPFHAAGRGATEASTPISAEDKATVGRRVALGAAVTAGLPPPPLPHLLTPCTPNPPLRLCFVPTSPL
jgi:hypothetical protein